MSTKKKQGNDWDLRIDTKAMLYLEKLPKEISHRIYKKLHENKKNPFHYFDRLEGRREYKLRVGDYRVIADLIKKEIAIFVIEIGHRKNIY